mmetsp:Transcript_28076/g.53469  ORF Transcript_28076/g.53469 Transcript_28076/m.53469 type:complete len:339 (+) Transcript_28076:938-1954(+)
MRQACLLRVSSRRPHVPVPCSMLRPARRIRRWSRWPAVQLHLLPHARRHSILIVFPGRSRLVRQARLARPRPQCHLRGGTRLRVQGERAQGGGRRDARHLPGGPKVTLGDPVRQGQRALQLLALFVPVLGRVRVGLRVCCCRRRRRRLRSWRCLDARSDARSHPERAAQPAPRPCTQHRTRGALLRLRCWGEGSIRRFPVRLRAFTAALLLLRWLRGGRRPAYGGGVLLAPLGVPPPAPPHTPPARRLRRHLTLRARAPSRVVLLPAGSDVRVAHRQVLARGARPRTQLWIQRVQRGGGAGANRVRGGLTPLRRAFVTSACPRPGSAQRRPGSRLAIL